MASVTGIAAEDIRKLAREYATTRPSVIRIGVAVERHSGGGQTVRALTCLPALVGAWRDVGGGILQLPVWAFPVKWDSLMRPDWIKPGTRVLNQWKLGAALTGELELDPPIQSLFVYNANPAVVAPEQEKVLNGLAREDLFTVVSEHFITDTARYADIVLPATTQMEQHEIMFSWGHFYLSLNHRAIQPCGEAVPNTELFRRLAAAMGYDDPFFRRSDEQMAVEALDWSSPALQGITMEQLQRDGFARLKVGTPDTYAPHAAGNFPTPSGKVELKASMAAGGNFVLPLFRQGSNEFQDGSPVDPLPCFIAPQESADTNRRPGLEVSAERSHAQEPRVPQLGLREHRTTARSRRRSVRDDAPERRAGARHRRRRACGSVQRSRPLRGRGTGQRRGASRRRGDASRLLGVGQPDRSIRQRRERLALRRFGQSADLLRYAGGCETGRSVEEAVSLARWEGATCSLFPPCRDVKPRR